MNIRFAWEFTPANQNVESLKWMDLDAIVCYNDNNEIIDRFSNWL